MADVLDKIIVPHDKQKGDVFKKSKKEKEQDASIQRVEKKTEKTQKFQEVLEKDLKEVFSREETRWFWISFVSISITVSVIISLIVEFPPCFFTQEESSQYHFLRTASLVVFLTSVTFFVLGQYNKAINLHIDSTNRLAMAKLLARVESELNPKDWHDEAYRRLLQAIVYRHAFGKNKSKGQDTGTSLEDIQQQLSKLTQLISKK